MKDKSIVWKRTVAIALMASTVFALSCPVYASAKPIKIQKEDTAKTKVSSEFATAPNIALNEKKKLEGVYGQKYCFKFVPTESARYEIKVSDYNFAQIYTEDDVAINPNDIMLQKGKVYYLLARYDGKADENNQFTVSIGKSAEYNKKNKTLSDYIASGYVGSLKEDTPELIRSGYYEDYYSFCPSKSGTYQIEYINGKEDDWVSYTIYSDSTNSLVEDHIDGYKDEYTLTGGTTYYIKLSARQMCAVKISKAQNYMNKKFQSYCQKNGGDIRYYNDRNWNLETTPGENYCLGVEVLDPTASVSYQWVKRTSDGNWETQVIQGATSSTYSFTKGYAGEDYECKVSFDGGKTWEGY